MEFNDRYTFARAQDEASRLQNKIQTGEAPNYKQAELQVEAEKLIHDPETALREFINTPFTAAQAVRKWVPTLLFNIKERLEGRPAGRYLFSLGQAATAMNAEKEKIITAALLYEMEHRAEMKQGPSYNPTVLLRTVMNLAKSQTKLLGEAMRQYLDSLSLEEIYKNFQGKKNLASEDMPNLAEMALTRSNRQGDAAVAKEILRIARMDIFRQVGGTPRDKRTYLRVQSFLEPSRSSDVLNAERYSPAVLNRVLSDLKETGPDTFSNFIQELHSQEERLSANILYNEQELQNNQAPSKEYDIKNALKRDRCVLSWLRKTVEQAPVLSDAYKTVVDEKKTAREEEVKREEERKREQDEERAKIDFANEQERQRQNEERDRIYREEFARKKEEAGLECDRFVTELPQFSVDFSIIDEQINAKVQQLELDKLAPLINFDHWEILRRSAEAVPLSLDRLNDRQNSLFWRQGLEEKKRAVLSQTWEENKKKLEAAVVAALFDRQDKIQDILDRRFATLIKKDSNADDLKKCLDALKKSLENIQHSVGQTEDEKARQFLQNIADSVERKMNEILAIYDKLRAQMEDEEKREAITSTQDKYLRDLIERHTAYLQELYSIGTGLGLAYVESRASHEAGSSVGSVSLRMAPTIALKQELELKLELVAEHDNLTLEMGEDLESIRKRWAMVNWVAPHEIAHLVDLASDMSQRLFTEEELVPMKKLLDNWRGSHKKLAEEMVPYIIKEAAIDGVGYRMLKEYGSDDPFEKTKAQRIAAALRGYVAMMDVLTHILDERAEEDVDTKARYAIVLLREIADGEILVEEAKGARLVQNLIYQVEKEITKLWKVFEKFNQESDFIAHGAFRGQVRDVIDLCKHYFKTAEKVPLVSRSRE